MGRAFLYVSIYWEENGKKIHAYDWTELPIDKDVIDRVEELSTSENQPEIIDNLPLFEWRAGESILDDYYTTTESDLDIIEDESGSK